MNIQCIHASRFGNGVEVAGEFRPSATRPTGTTPCRSRPRPGGPSGTPLEDGWQQKVDAFADRIPLTLGAPGA
jgi:hypothetical protein